MSVDLSFRACLLAAAMLTTNSVASLPLPSERTTLDCGVNSLFLLLSLEGHPSTLNSLDAALPARHPDGYSMAELAAASRALGLSLDGIQLAKGGPPLDGPVIVFIKDTKLGHFALLRPVGTTGTMVQVLDAPSAPQIVDMARLVAMKSWTGRALIPRTPWYRRYAPTLLAAAVGLGLIGWWTRQRFRRP